MSYWIVHFLNGISFGMVLFLIAAGLSLILGLMHILNITHGAFYILGAYIAISTYHFTENFVFSVMSGTIAIGVIGIIFQRFLLRRFQNNMMSQMLLTIGFVYIFSHFTYDGTAAEEHSHNIHIHNLPPFLDRNLLERTWDHVSYGCIVH